MDYQKQQIKTADQSDIDRLVQAASADGEEDGYAGKRSVKRVSSVLPVDVCLDPETGNDIWAGSMHDVSGGGFALWSKREVRPRTPIYIREYSDDGCHPWILATVTHCTVGIRGNLVGAEFEIVSTFNSVPKPAAKNPQRFNPLPPVPFIPRLRG